MEIKKLTPNINNISELNFIQRKIANLSLILVVFIALVVFITGRKELSRGIIAGGLASILNFTLLAMDVKKVSFIKRAKTFFFSHYIFRYILLGLILFISIMWEGLNFFLGVSLGLFSVPLAIYIIFLTSNFKISRI